MAIKDWSKEHYWLVGAALVILICVAFAATWTSAYNAGYNAEAQAKVTQNATFTQSAEYLCNNFILAPFNTTSSRVFMGVTLNGVNIQNVSVEMPIQIGTRNMSSSVNRTTGAVTFIGTFVCGRLNQSG
jgi:flagellar biosynthesis protein FliP